MGHALQQALDPNSKVNSLLAEVDDRRAAMECQLNSMKISVSEEAQCIHQRADEVTNLHTAEDAGSQTELKQQERLFAMLEQKNGEIKLLLGEIKNLEKFKTLYESMESKPFTSASPCSLEDIIYFADLLQLKLDKLNKENESTRGELPTQRMKALFESQRPWILSGNCL